MSSSRISKVARGPRSVGAGVCGDNSVARQQLVQFEPTTCGFIGVSRCSPCSFRLWRHSRMLFCAASTKRRSWFGRSSASNARSVGAASPPSRTRRDSEARSARCLCRSAPRGSCRACDNVRYTESSLPTISNVFAGQQRLRALPIGSLAVYMSLMKTLILAALVLLLSTRAAARARDRNRPNRNAACEGRPGAAESEYA